MTWWTSRSAWSAGSSRATSCPSGTAWTETTFRTCRRSRMCPRRTPGSTPRRSGPSPTTRRRPATSTRRRRRDAVDRAAGGGLAHLSGAPFPASDAMTLARPNLFKLLAVTATFVAALGAFSLITRSGDGAARSGLAASDADLARPGAPTDERIHGYQAAVRAQPGDAGLRAALG